MIRGLLELKTFIMKEYGSHQHGAIQSITVTPEFWDRLIVDLTSRARYKVPDERYYTGNMNICEIDIKRGT